MFLLTAGSGLSLANLKLLLGSERAGLQAAMHWRPHACMSLSSVPFQTQRRLFVRRVARSEEMLKDLVVVRVLAAVQPPLRLTS